MSITLQFDGYWREPYIGSVPNKSGVYCVYDCTKNNNKTVTIRKLIYIGESEDVRDRIKNHGKREEWKRHLQPGGELCFSFAPITTDRDRAEAALIFKHKPPVNVEYKHEFPFPTTMMTLRGQTTKLDTNFTVRSTTRKAQ